MQIELIANWNAVNDETRQYTFKDVVLPCVANGIEVTYKNRRGVNTLTVYIDGKAQAVVACAITSQFNDKEVVRAQLPEISAGKHDIMLECSENAYWEKIVLIEENPFAAQPQMPDYKFRDTDNDLIVATDMLGRKLPEEEASSPRNKLVGLFYWTWRNEDIYRTPRNLMNIFKAAPEARYDINHPIWTNNDKCHWNEPFYGYYLNNDPYVLRKHAQYFANAGVDSILFDCTNGSFIWKESYMPLMEEFDKARKDGIRTPQVAFILNFGPMDSSLRMLRSVYQDLYKPGLYKDQWFMWDGKPLIMAYPESIPAKGVSEFDTALLQEIREFFTFRPPQPLYGGGATRPDHWGWLEKAPQNGYVKKPDGGYEMCTIGVGQNCNDERICTHFSDKGTYGRSYTDKDKHSKLTEDSYKYGYNVQEQWDNAMNIDPDFVFITGWNEWTVGKSNFKPWIQEEGSTEIAFVDQFDYEHSRDIEPDIDGYLDTYYLQMVANIRKFKGLKHVDRPEGLHTIDADSPDSWNDAWKDVKPEFISHKGTAAKRNFPGMGMTYYTNRTGNNNITLAKIAYDEKNVYFYVECAENIKLTGETSMNLLIDVDRDKKTGYEGYDIIVKNNRAYKYAGSGFTPVKIQPVKVRFYENKGVVVIPADLMFDGGFAKKEDGSIIRPTFEFKWSDNIQPGNIMNFYSDGDCAPFGRFNYLY